MRNKVASGSILFLFLIFGLVISQEKNVLKKDQSQLERKQKFDPQDQLIIPRIKVLVTLEGLSNDQAWEGIEPLPVVQHTPNFGNEPTERTEILMAYSDDYLYVGVDPLTLLHKYFNNI
jgi:hypothetical protein